MTTISFKGFGGIKLEAEQFGNPGDPLVLLVPGAGQTRAVWHEVAVGLVGAGRQVISLDLRGHGGSDRPADARYDVEALVGDLRAVLAQLEMRPVVVAASLGAWATVLALAGDAANLAAGLVLADLPVQFDAEASRRVADRLRSHRDANSEDWDDRLIGAIDLSGISEQLASVAPSLSLPVLFVRAADSQLDSAADAAAFVALIPNAEAAEVENTRFVVSALTIDTFGAVLLDFMERRLPRAVPEFRQGSEPRLLRDALGCFATGVTVVTALTPEGKPVGLTANSFTSVSLDPPLLLVCIASNSGTAPVLREAKHFAVNVLHIGQQTVSNRFAGKIEDRFAEQDWSLGETGSPIFGGALSAFECAHHAVHDGGDHFILVGRVMRATFEPRRDPLLYFRGKYRRLHFT